MPRKKDTAYWRGLVAASADIEIGIVTQFSPEGLAEALGQPRYWLVRLGPLVLRLDGTWRYHERGASLKERLKDAHLTPQAALATLRAAVAPDEPACAATIVAVHGEEYTGLRRGR